MTYKKKLIEVALPLDAINTESTREKQIRMGHPSTLHRWWARRPLAAVRAVLWASIVDDPSAHPERFATEHDQEVERQRLFRILEELVKWGNSNNERVLDAARAEILASCDGDLPNILDPFCGGGTIPLEAQRLGLSAYGGDLNPVAVLITKAMVEIPPRFAGLAPVNSDAQAELGLKTWEGVQGLADDVRHYGQWMRDRAFERIGDLYPKVALSSERGDGDATVIAWIWARTVESPDPSWDGHVPLVRSWVLRNAKKDKPVAWVEPIVHDDTRTVSYRIREGGTPPSPTIRRGARGTCVATGSPITPDHIYAEGVANRIGTDLIAVVVDTPQGRAFLPPAELPPVPDATWHPAGELPKNPRWFSPPLYGMRGWADLFTRRQLVALNTFSELLPDVGELILREAIQNEFPDDDVPLGAGGRGATAYRDAILTYLALGIGRMAEINTAFCPWESGRQQVRNLFGRQAIPMHWNFAEANVFGRAAGDYSVSLGSLVRALERLPGRGFGDIQQRDAKARMNEVEAPVISTDPPYYDNIGYADLSDFFYVWLRRNLMSVWPDELSTLVTPKAEELIADPARAGSRIAAREHFEYGMEEVLAALAGAQSERFPATIFYAFKQEEVTEKGTASTGWETFLEGLIRSGVSVVATWPIRTELVVALKKDVAALASSIVIACRPRPVHAPLATRSEYLVALRSDLPDAIRLLQKESIAPVDMAQSAIGPGMAVFSRFSKVIEADGSAMSVRQALVLINEVLEEVLSAAETEFDPDTRWALTWFEQYGLNPGPFGDAETLSKAKGTSVDGVSQAGVATQLDGKVRLLDRRELADEWDPAEDSRLTVWEVAQHLIARLDNSEIAAADLLRRVGSGMGERARVLAYLLFQMADRKGWSSEAVAYNSLVRAWPELSRLAARNSGPEQQTLGE